MIFLIVITIIIIIIIIIIINFIIIIIILFLFFYNNLFPRAQVQEVGNGFRRGVGVEQPEGKEFKSIHANV